MMDEVFSLDILYADEYIPEQLYQLVRHGLCSQLDTRLHELSNSTEYLTALTWHSQEQLSLLMVAALNGYDDIVRVLLTHCDPTRQIELKGKVIISGEKCVKGATAFYCACYRGYFTVAKTLIELGHANVNQDTYNYPHYPLFIHATIMNRQDIVHFLLENKYADVNETKSDDSDECTALIWAAFRGYTSLVKYLIENGADVNYSSRDKNSRPSTAIMCATLRGHVDVLRLLYNAGANTNIGRDTGDTLLMTAAENKHYSIVSFLLEQSINNTVDDLELAACSLFDISSSNDQMNLVFDLLRVALQQRQLLHIPKVCIQSMDIYNYEQECQTIDELDRVKADRDRIFIETLLIRERIYSSRKDITVMEPLENYGDRLAYKKEFDKCLNVYFHLFYLYCQVDVHVNLSRFVWLFCKMLTENRTIPIRAFVQVCCLTFEITRSKDMKYTISNALFLVIIATQILEQKGITKEEQTLIYSWIRDLCRHRLTTPDGQTLLHLCVDTNTNDSLNFRPTDTITHIKFPNESGLRLLLDCGSRWLDLDAIEPSFGNTPLHIICKRNGDQKIIKLLLNSGCHMDCVNKGGKIPLDYVNNKEIKALFTTKPTPDPLKCLCARIIANKRLNTGTSSALTSALKKFVFLHGSLRTQSDFLPICFLYLCSFNLVLCATNYLIYSTACLLHANESFCSEIDHNKSLRLSQETIQKESSQWSPYGTLSFAIIACFISPIYGSLSDTKNRKLPIVLTISNVIITGLIITIENIFRGTKTCLVLYILANIVNGFSGGTLILTSSCFGYAIDVCSKKEQHAPAIAVIEASLNIEAVIGYVLCTFIFELHAKIWQLLLVHVLLLFLALFISLVFLRSRKVTDSSTLINLWIKIKRPFIDIHDLIIDLKINASLLSFIILLLSLFFYELFRMSSSLVFYLYLYRMLFNGTQYAAYFTCELLGTCFALIFLALLRRQWKINDLYLCIIGLCLSLAGLMLFAFALNKKR
ncbi:unnamed protein product [Rotaria sp. Silwood2]|nr:unnamed protein product [Rotaria sp. Silwood2]